MVKEEVPLIAFESDASAPILRYDVPSPSTYEGRNYIELDLGELVNKLFNKAATRIPPPEELMKGFLSSNQDEIHEYLTGVSKKELEHLVYWVELDKIRLENPSERPPTRMHRMRMDGGGTGASRGKGTISSTKPIDIARLDIEYTSARNTLTEEETIENKYKIFKSRMEMALSEKMYPSFYRTMSGGLKLRFVELPPEEEVAPMLMFIETYKLTTYPGDYGAGTTIKTFTLLPGEETEISIKTWKKETTTTKEASSILDSYTTDKADEFEKGVQKENSNQSKVEKSKSYHAEAEASASWGWGSAKVSGGVAGSSNAAREESSKNVMNATEKHSQTASAKREVNIDTSYDRTADQGEEQTITRRIKNLNASRTLNFVFRQMNQEFHSIIHMTDERVAFFNGYPGSMKEYALYKLEDLVRDFMKSEVPSNGGTTNTLQFLTNLIMGEYGPNRVFDYQGATKQLVERKEIPADGGGAAHTYLRVIPARKDPTTGEQFGRQKYVMREKDEERGQEEDARYVDGIIVSARKFTMRTDGVIVESLLGKAPALDRYALDTQIEVLREKKLGNDKIQAGIDIVQKLKDAGNANDAVDAYQKMFVPPIKSDAT